MRSFVALAVGAGLLVSVAWQGQGAAPPLSRLTQERVRLAKQVSEHNLRLEQLYGQGKIADAVEAAGQVLHVRQLLYSPKDYPDGHPELAASLNNLGVLLASMGEPAKALGYFEQALVMRQKLYSETIYKDGHPLLASSLSNLGLVLNDVGQPARALAYHEKALAMKQKLYPETRYPAGHPELAGSLNNLGNVLNAMGDPTRALGYYETALAMNQKLYPVERFKDGHRELALSLHNLGLVLNAMGNHTRAVGYYETALKMHEKLYPETRYPDGHPDLASSLSNLGGVLKDKGELTRALGYAEKALAMRQRLYPEARFKDGHPHLATSLHNLSSMLKDMGEFDRAMRYAEKALDMQRKLYPVARYPDGHPDLASSLNNLGTMLQDLGEPARALGYYEKALAAWQRLYPKFHYPDGHPDLAFSLNNMGSVLKDMGHLVKAKGFFEKALATRQKLYPPVRFKDGHPHLAMSLNNLGVVLQTLGDHAGALAYHEQALAMWWKLYPEPLYKDGHPDLAMSLNNLGVVLKNKGELAGALAYFEKARAMQQTLYPEARFKDGHPNLALSLNNLGAVFQALGEHATAMGYCEKALDASRRQANRVLGATPEAQALAFLATLPRTQSGYLSVALSLPNTTVKSYEAIWPGRVAAFQQMLCRHESTRIALLKSDRATTTWQQLSDVRRQISRQMFQSGQDPAARDKALAKLEHDQDRLEREMVTLLPELDAHKQLAQLGPQDLAGQLPVGSAFLDFVRYDHFSKGNFTGSRYLAFVLTPNRRIQRLELGDTKTIDEAILAWRGNINSGAGKAPSLLRELVWERVEKSLPAGTHTLYLGLDGELARLPFAALPGRKPDTVLLEDYTIAVVPAGQWLLQQLYKPLAKDTFPKLVAAGNVNFGEGAYPALPGTKHELSRVVETLPGGVIVDGKDATVTALRKHLPEARIAHLATHAYFDKKSLDEEHKRIVKHRETWTLNAQGSDRVGLALRHPMGFVGLLLAGGNDPKSADGGGILTGLDILELPLNKMHLCVLSACETGLGQWEADAGVAGLQRAFHVAGCRNVVGSLWQVDDEATAALMAKFYHEMHVNKRTPLAALREAQLTVYRHPERIADLAGTRGKIATLNAAKQPLAVAKGKTSPTRLWAAFVLSGPGN